MDDYQTTAGGGEEEGANSLHCIPDLFPNGLVAVEGPTNSLTWLSTTHNPSGCTFGREKIFSSVKQHFAFITQLHKLFAKHSQGG